MISSRTYRRGKKEVIGVKGLLPESAYGAAIDYCYEDEEGKLWITNEEYASQVNIIPLVDAKRK